MTHFAAHIDTAPLEEILELCAFLRGRWAGFNPYEVVQKYKGKHPQAIIDALKAVAQRVHGPLKVGRPWGYINTVVTKQNQNYNERDTVRAWDDLKISIGECAPEVQAIAGRLFGAVSG